jgi:hypothetical protein
MNPKPISPLDLPDPSPPAAPNPPDQRYERAKGKPATDQAAPVE